MSLTSRERQILALLLEGKTNAEIGAAIGKSEQSVKNCLTGIYAHFGINTERGRQVDRRLFPLIEEIRRELAVG